MTLWFCVWLRKHEKCGYFGGSSFHHGYFFYHNVININYVTNIYGFEIRPFSLKCQLNAKQNVIRSVLITGLSFWVKLTEL
jgi:hypothetical protein